MIHRILATATFVLAAPLFADVSQQARDLLASRPLVFEPADNARTGRFLARGNAGEFVFESNHVLLRSRNVASRLEFAGANPRAHARGLEKLQSVTNIFRGSDAASWRKAIPNFGRIEVLDLYPGVGLVYYGNARELEYDLRVQPGTNPGIVRLRLDGAGINEAGDLTGAFVQKKPTAYQVAANGARIPVESRYRKNADGTFGFALGAYDHTREVVIDPVLTLASYIGGSNEDFTVGVGRDANGNLYVAGTTYSTDIPLHSSPYQTTNTGLSSNLFVYKFNPSASPSARIVYSTYLGGTGADVLNCMAVSASGNVYMAGTTTSADFPTANPEQSAITGTVSMFVTRLDPSQGGTAGLQYSTYYGGTGIDTPNGIAVNSAGKIAITGSTTSTDLKLTSGFQTALLGGEDGFLAVFDPSLGTTATLVYATYMGGTNSDAGESVAAGTGNTWWVAGETQSHDYWNTPSSYQVYYGGDLDAFLTQVDSSDSGSTSLLYSTYLGGSQLDSPNKVFVNSAGQIVITGYSESPNFPVTPNALQAQNKGNGDAFVTIMDPAKSPTSQLIYSTLFGGSEGDAGYDVTQDADGRLYVVGFTMSPDILATAGALQGSFDGTMSGFLAILDPSQSGSAALDYFSYLGSDGVQLSNGVAVDSSGDVYVSGYTTANLLSPLGGPSKTTPAGTSDGFILGFNPDLSTGSQLRSSRKKSDTSPVLKAH